MEGFIAAQCFSSNLARSQKRESSTAPIAIMKKKIMEFESVSQHFKVMNNLRIVAHIHWSFLCCKSWSMDLQYHLFHI